jgi:polysaccharide transporter, PST family
VSAYFDRGVPEGLGARSARGALAMIVARAVTAVLQIGCILWLARLLTPEDYGLVAMVTALTGSAPLLVDLGTRDAVVQRAGIAEGEVSALFWLTVGVGCTCALAVFAGGPLVAGFYREPRLAAMMRVSSLTFVALALTAQHQSLLRRAVRFRELAVVDIVANVAGAAGALAMAYCGFGYWVLIVRPVAMYAFSAAGTWWYCGWVPRRPAVTSGVREMVRFGLYLSGFSLTEFVRRNCDRVVVGRGLGARALGYYQNSFLVYDNVLDILVLCLHQVAVSGLSRLQHEPAALRRAWRKALSMVVFYAMPAFGILAVTSVDLIVLLLGAQWAPTGALLSVLALGGIAQAAELTLGWLHVVAGRTDRWLRWGVLATAVRLVILVGGLPFGIVGIAWAHVVTIYVLFVPALAYAGRPLGIGARDVVSVIGPPLAGALLAAGAGFAVRDPLLGDLAPPARMAVLTVLFFATYLAVVVGVFRRVGPLQVSLGLARGFLRSASSRAARRQVPVAPE